MPTVFGVVRTETLAPALGATVRAFDKDLRHEELLGRFVIDETSGRYEIAYSPEQFRRAEKKSADLIVRAFDREGRLRAESPIRFNAAVDERIDLTFGRLPVVERPRLSELEALQQSIEPVREGIAYREFTDPDLVLLTEEAIRGDGTGASERRTMRQRLEFLRLADRFAGETSLPIAAFYGWFRRDQPRELDVLLDVPAAALQAELVAAIRDNIIPDIGRGIQRILERIRAMRFALGRIINHRFAVRLLDEESGRPLIGYSVAVSDASSERGEPLGTVVTDGYGICAIAFALERRSSAPAERPLRLTIAKGEVALGEATIVAQANQEAVTTLSVRLRRDETGNVPIDGAAPAPLAERLRAQGIRTLDDVLAHPDLQDDDTHALELLRATAKLAVFLPDASAAARRHLLESRLRSLRDIAGSSRAEFIGRHGDALGGEATSFATLDATRGSVAVLHHMIGSAWLKQVTTPGDDPEDPDIPTGVNEALAAFQTCGCKDCLGAVSPAAYLAHLLQWTLDHVKDGTTSIAFGQLQEEFHQPFGDLPASCSAVEKQVRQVRIAVEVLWRFTALIARDDLQLTSSFRAAYRELRNRLYRGILTQLGTSFEQLRRAMLPIAGGGASAQQVAVQRRAVADVLGIDESRLVGLFFNVDQPPVSPSEDELQQRFGYRSTRAADVFASLPTPDLVAWQWERLEAIWRKQDFQADAYSGEPRLPVVDPVLIDESYLRAPLESNAAFALLEARGTAIVSHRQQLVDANPEPGGLAALLESELGEGIDQLRDLFGILMAGEQGEAVVEAQAAIASLRLTPAAFVHVMDIDSRLQAGQAIADTPEGIEAAWASVFDILAGAHRRALFAQWVEEEDALPLLFGPELFWLPVAAAVPPNPWQATSDERLTWEEALACRSGPPIIDPDQIAASRIVIIAYLVGFGEPDDELPLAATQPPLDAMDLWQQRRAWVDGRLDAFREARQNASGVLATLEAALGASTTGIDLDTLAELASADADGGDLAPRLAQLGMTKSGYRRLAEVHELAQAGASVTTDTWHSVDATLAAIEKRRRFARWRTEENAADVTLHPHRFVIPQDPQVAAEASFVAELHDPIALQQWTDRLQARIDQRSASRANVEQAVAAGEEAVLPLLRNILVMESVAAGSSLADKTDWLDRRLLIDMRMDGCQLTTRVSQAIETLQRLVRGVFAREHMSLMDHITLDADEDYEAEWPVLGSYAIWRAFMLAYLFPENLMHLTPPRRQSHGFESLKQLLPPRATHAQTCARAQAYGDYLKDVCSLEIQASCQIRTFAGGEPESCEPSTTAAPSMLHAFARAQASGKVYWATLNPAQEYADTTSTWKAIPTLGVVERICGATCHFTPGGKRFVLLFTAVRQSGKMELRVAKFDADELSWGNDTALALPAQADSGFSACVIQKRGAAPDAAEGDLGFPTLVAVKPKQGPVYVNQLSDEAAGWSSVAWTPLFGPGMNERFKRVLALVQRTSNEYLVVCELGGSDAGIYYRLLYRTGSGRDDVTWTSLGISEAYNGAFSWFGDPRTFLFYSDAGQTVYRVVRGTGDLEDSSAFTYHEDVDVDDSLGLEERLHDEARQIAEDIARFNEEWLERWVGISLRDFKLSNFRPQFFVPRDDEEGEIDPLNPDRENVAESEGAVGFAGITLDLVDVFFYELKGIDITLPDDARFRYDALDLEFYRIQLQYQFVQEFLKHIAGIDGAKLLEGDLGRWKFADQQVRRFSDEGLSLADLIRRFRDNLTQVYLPIYNDGIYPRQATRFRERHTGEELSFARTASGEQWLFAPTSGDERAGGVARKAVVLQERNGRAFWTRLRRTGDALSHSTLKQLAPRGSGPFNLLPQRDLAPLKQRRLDIETIWKPHRDAPPSVRMYLKEAYNLLPMHLGYASQRAGDYEEALLWYRQVFDYLQPSGAQRRIDYSLRLEEELGYGFSDAEEWLDDASNAHAIAATRKNTYTRHALLMIIRCMIEYADALFSRDNVSDNSRATELYTRVLALLGLSTMHPGTSMCANILGEMEVDVVDSIVLPVQQFKLALGKMPDPDRLRPAVATLAAIARDTSRTSLERLRQMRDSVLAAVADIPAPPTMAGVVGAKRAAMSSLENQVAAHPSSRAILTRVQQRRRQSAMASLAAITGRSEEELERGSIALPWLRAARPADDEGPEPLPPTTLVVVGGPARLAVSAHIDTLLPMSSLAAKQGNHFTPAGGISFDFCIPQNPVIQALQTRARNNLVKLRTCRNIAGLERQLDPYGAPIGIGSGLVSADGSLFSGVIDAPPTPYRYAALISRAKELVQISQQVEAGYQSALERAETEAFSVMQAEQGADLAAARIAVHDLRLAQAAGDLGLAQLQRAGAQLRASTYADWIAAGPSDFENSMLQAYKDAGAAQRSAAIAAATAQAASFQMAALPPDSFADKVGGLVTGTYVARAVLANVATAAAVAEGVYNVKAIQAQTSGQLSAALASFERRNEEWQLQREIAARDVQIGDQQISLAQGQIDIARQERVIAGLEQTHAVDTLNFLLTKQFNEEMYRWIASVLEDVYRFFLQQATAIARLAERQLAFERQQAPLKVIQGDYWSPPAESSSAGSGAGIDRLGLTGSARLLKDIYQLDGYAFGMRQRKQGLTLTLDLAALYPFEFQQFRETGTLVFDTPQRLIDEQLPGYYLCLIQQVSVSVVALVSRTYGIRATLTSAGISRVVIGGDTFQTVTVRNLPESMALTSATPAPGVVSLEPDGHLLLNPFEGTGFDTRWKLQMPIGSNAFDFDSMATVLFTISLTALYSGDYERQVTALRDRRLRFDRAFDFRQVFADQWYDLNNPDQTATPMAVRFDTRRSDFPPNLLHLSIQHVMLYVVRRNGEGFEQPIRHLYFTGDGNHGPVGGATSTVNGRISTRASNGANWLPTIGQSPVGAWELAFPDDADTRQRFADESIENILLVISVMGETPG